MKRIFKEHFNCFPWFVCGLLSMLDGEVSVMNYFLCWLCLLIMIWHYMPNKN